jgi:FkbM family methyltransferase
MGLIQTVRFIVRHPLGRKHPLRNLADYLRWQVGSRILPGPVIVDWIAGTRLIVEPGMTGASGNLYVGLHEVEEMGFALHLLRPHDLMVDVGANIGSYTILAAGVCHADVHSFEPIGEAFGRLVRNVRHNGLEARVFLHQVAVGAAPGELRMEAGLDTTNRVLGDDERSDMTATVGVTTLDRALGEAAPTLVKIDVEGFEREVLMGASGTLARSSAVLIEVSRHADEVFARLGQAGLKPCEYDPFSRRLVALPAPRVNARGNALFVRDLDWAADRCRSAPHRKVKGVSL